MPNRPQINKHSLGAVNLKNGLSFFIILLLSAIVFIWPDANPHLEFNRINLQQHEYYRLFTSSLVHNNIHHLWLNLLGGLLLYLLFFEHFTPINQIVVFIICSLSVSIGIFYFSSFDIYMGLSGYLHGIFAWAVLKELLSKRKSAWLLAIVGIAKLVHEQVAEQSQPQETLIGIAIATDAHLFGALGGVLLCLFTLTLTKLRVIQSQ